MDAVGGLSSRRSVQDTPLRDAASSLTRARITPRASRSSIDRDVRRHASNVTSGTPVDLSTFATLDWGCDALRRWDTERRGL